MFPAGVNPAWDERRLGTLHLSAEEWLSAFADPIRAQCVPLRVEYSFARQAFEIQALSERFQRVAPCGAPLAYGITREVVTGEDGHTELVFREFNDQARTITLWRGEEV